MKRVLFVVLVLAFTIGVTQAAEIDTKAGTKQLVFQFSGLSNLGLNTYNGGIGMRYYLSDGMALRPGLVFGLSGNTVKAASGNTDHKTGSASLGFNVVGEKHLSGPASVSPYVGVGASFLSTSTVDEPSVPTSPPTDTVTKTTVSQWSVGGLGVIGFEWAFTQSVTLGGEYQVSLVYGSGKTEAEITGRPKATANDHSSLSAGFGTASVFLSVAF
jgi:hypothetical protein